jgi:hypothetical protein
VWLESQRCPQSRDNRPIINVGSSKKCKSEIKHERLRLKLQTSIHSDVKARCRKDLDVSQRQIQQIQDPDTRSFASLAATISQQITGAISRYDTKIEIQDVKVLKHH